MGEDCGNSPKNKFLTELSSAFARGDVEFMVSKSTKDIPFERPGIITTHGIAEFSSALQYWAEQHQVEKLVLRHAISHGRAGAVNGIMEMENGDSFAFCFVFEFSSVKGNAINALTLYMIASYPV